MKKYLRAIWYSFPVQLFFLHLRKYQLLLLFWYLLASAISGGFMHHYGANSLFLSPEYNGNVNFLSALFTGAAYGVFLMSWNITAFILFGNHIKFLAATSRPFLKFCINNSIIPLIFFINYFIQLIKFDRFSELMSYGEIFFIAFGFICGVVLFIIISIAYFYGSERAILKQLHPVLTNPKQFREKFNPLKKAEQTATVINVQYFLNESLRFRKTRNVSHYSQAFLDVIFKRHHFAAVVAILLAFFFLFLYGFFLDYPFMQLPAAASIFIFFAILIAASGAMAYWLNTWSIPFALLLVFVLNLFFQNETIDIRNKAFGLNYGNKEERPEYSLASLKSICTPEQIKQDSLQMIQVLENWKKHQQEKKPLLYVLNVSGGGNRSATFTVNTLSRLDSFLNHTLMQKTFLFSGASGGMLGMTYYRELYRQKQKGILVNDERENISSNISKDILNAIFSSYVTRDIVTPVQRFSVGNYRYVKDRGYSFEVQFNNNTGNILNNRLEDYKAEETHATIPLGLFSSTVSQDGRKLMICTQPISFLMQPKSNSSNGFSADPDAIDYAAFFKHHDPLNTRMLTALRMNATFPYVLPNVWLPTKPIVDVMDAGLRDNYGEEITLRFLHFFSDWIKANTSGIAFIQIRDRNKGDWNEEISSPGIGDIVYKPVVTLQYNFYKIQDYLHESMISYSSTLSLHSFTFIYTPEEKTNSAALNFHLTTREKKQIVSAVFNKKNEEIFKNILLLQQSISSKNNQGISKK